MATKKTEGEWKSQTQASYTPVDSTTARYDAELVKAPDGKRMVAVRKYAIKKDGTEIRTNSAIMLAFDENTDTDLRGIAKLFRTLADLVESKK